MKPFLFFLVLVPAWCDSLQYAINWPSGLSLGEATLVADHGGEKTGGNWNLSLNIDASIPGFAVRDDYRAAASTDLCGLQFDKTFTHGTHKTEEHLKFDQHGHTVSRETQGGGKSEMSVSTCARDPLTYIEFLRHELAEGRLPQQQEVIYGALYSVKVEYTGNQTIPVGEKKVDADRIVATIKGPSSDLNVEMFFARGGTRAPLLVRIPTALGTFSVVLQP